MAIYEHALVKAQSSNMVDERNILTVANAKALPNGEYGLCMLCVNGNKLRIYRTDYNHHIGKMLYDITLNCIRNIECCHQALNRYLIFVYDKRKYYFTGFGDARHFISVILEESEKRPVNN